MYTESSSLASNLNGRGGWLSTVPGSSQHWFSDGRRVRIRRAADVVKCSRTGGSDVTVTSRDPDPRQSVKIWTCLKTPASADTVCDWLAREVFVLAKSDPQQPHRSQFQHGKAIDTVDVLGAWGWSGGWLYSLLSRLGVWRIKRKFLHRYAGSDSIVCIACNEFVIKDLSGLEDTT